MLDLVRISERDLERLLKRIGGLAIATEGLLEETFHVRRVAVVASRSRIAEAHACDDLGVVAGEGQRANRGHVEAATHADRAFFADDFVRGLGAVRTAAGTPVDSR